MNKKVIIVQRRLTHYRVAFFQSLRQALEVHGVELELLVGAGTQEENQKQDSGNISWAIQIPTRYFLKNRLCWQPVYKYLADADLVIVTQENALLANHLLILRPRKFYLAFWGHGANFQSQHPDGLKERYKRWSSKRVDWWFAYTQLSADRLLENGFPGARMTVVNNSIDTSNFRHQIESVTTTEIESLKSSIGFSEGPVGVYIGSLYKNKRLDFLFSAAESIRDSLGTFNLLIIGDGPERNLAQSFCRKHSWAYWAGMQHGRKKAVHVATGQIMLNPGLVGLGILDSFASKVPILTTDCKIHSPEIAYLDNWKNGVMTSNNIDDYVETAVKLLENPDSMNSLRKSCAASAELFTLERMVSKFSNGILAVLTSDFGEHNGAE